MMKNSKEILRLHKTGISNREIADLVGVGHSTVAYNLKKHGLSSNWANEPIDIIDAFTARCKKCREIKPIIQFQHGRKGRKYEYRFAFCNECRRKQSRLNLNNDINKFLKDRFNRLKRRAVEEGIRFNLTFEYFLCQYNKQNGKCLYTDVEMKADVGSGTSYRSLTVDKIEPEKGYTIGNIVFCSRRANMIKSDLTLKELFHVIPLWHDKILNQMGYLY